MTNKAERIIVEALREQPRRFSELQSLALSQGVSAATLKRWLTKLKAQGRIAKGDGRYYAVASEPRSEPKPAANLNPSPVWLIDIADLQTQPSFVLPAGWVVIKPLNQ